MRVRESYRVPLLLLGCLVTALTFPRACAETRLAFGSLLPATAPLTAAETRDPVATLREENARLHHELQRLLEEQRARPPADGPEGSLRVVRPAGREPVGVLARVRHRDASASGRSFLVDVGRADGVVPDLAVICGGSLVGVVVTATEHAARVVRIDDPSTASIVSATILPAGDAASAGARHAPGVSRGTGDGETTVSFLRPGDAKPGDLAVTAVGSRRVPEGLVLGEVVAFGDDDRNGTYEAEVRPLRDLDTVDSVLVLVDDGETIPSLRTEGRK